MCDADWLKSSLHRSTKETVVDVVSGELAARLWGKEPVLPDDLASLATSLAAFGHRCL